MRYCLRCKQANSDDALECMKCHASMAGMPVFHSAGDFEYEGLHFHQLLHLRVQRRTALLAIAVQAAGMTLLALFPGLVLSWALLTHALGGALVGLGIVTGWLGPFRAMIAQAIVTVTLISLFGPLHPGSAVLVLFVAIGTYAVGIWMREDTDMHR